jgi:hypothetical protein
MRVLKCLSLLLIVLVLACSDSTEPKMTSVDTPLAARKADGYQPPVIVVPSVCSLPGHANSQACASALAGMGVALTAGLKDCIARQANACIRDAIGLSLGIYAWEHGLDQHGHTGPEYGWGRGGYRQDENLAPRQTWPGDPGYEEEPPLGEDGNNRYWWGSLRQEPDHQEGP